MQCRTELLVCLSPGMLDALQQAFTNDSFHCDGPILFIVDRQLQASMQSDSNRRLPQQHNEDIQTAELTASICESLAPITLPLMD